MTVVTEEQAPVSSRYCPEGYTAQINTLMNAPWPEGTTEQDCRASEHLIMAAVIDIAKKYQAGDWLAAEQLVADTLPNLPAEWSPLIAGCSSEKNGSM